MLTETLFYYLRHGETEWNKEHRMQGVTDIPLNATGIAQAHRAKDALRGCHIETICCSPLGRARETAQIVNEVLDARLIFSEGLKECCFGVWEGEVRANWYEDWRYRAVTPEGAESFDVFMERALNAVNQSLRNKGPVLIVGHGGVYWPVRERTWGDEGTIPNAVPIRHDPPNGKGAGWTTTLME